MAIANGEKGETMTRKEAELWMEYNCTGECDICCMRKVVPGTDERIDREPVYYCKCSLALLEAELNDL